MRDTPILTQRRKNCILVKTNLEKSFILGLLFVFQLTVSLLYHIPATSLFFCKLSGKIKIEKERSRSYENDFEDFCTSCAVGC